MSLIPLHRRLMALEEACNPEPLMSIGIELIDLDTGKVVGSIPPRLLEPGAPIDYRAALRELHDETINPPPPGRS